MTAYAIKGDRERCLKAGMDGYVCKPILKAELLAAIRQVRENPSSFPESPGVQHDQSTEDQPLQPGV